MSSNKERAIGLMNTFKTKIRALPSQPVRPILLRSREYVINHKLQTIVCLVVVFAAGIYWYGQRSNSAVKNIPVIPTVEYVTVKRSDLTKKISLAGKTVSDAQIDIATKYGGRVKTIRASLGQEVKKGEVLLVLDTAELEILIAQAQAVLDGASADVVEGGASFNANYAKAQSDYNLSVSNYQRYQNLYAQGAVSKVAFETIEQQMNATKAVLDSMANQFIGGRAASMLSKQANRDKAMSALDSLLAQKEEMSLKAPRDGIVGFRQSEEGSLVVAGQKLLAIVDNRKLFVDCTVSEQDVGFLSLLKQVDVFIEAVGQVVKADIIYISPSMDPATQSFVVRLLVTGRTDIIKAGLFAKTEIPILLKPGALFVPKEAIVTQTGKTTVYLLDEQNKVKEQAVTTGLKNDLMVEIEGVKPGDKVAVSNQSRLRNGIAVKPAEVTP